MLHTKFSIYRLLAALLMLVGLSGGVALASGSADYYRVNPTQSLVAIYTGKAGWFGELGHRHVIAIRQIEGEVYLRGLEHSTAQLTFNVAAMDVDNLQLRQQAGDGFKKQPDKAAIHGTGINMLGHKLLDAGNYPQIQVAIALQSLNDRQAIFKLKIHIKEQVVELQVPGLLEYVGDDLVISSTFSTTHKALGLVPFRAAGGMIRVAEQLDFKIEIIAHRQLDGDA